MWRSIDGKMLSITLPENWYDESLKEASLITQPTRKLSGPQNKQVLYLEIKPMDTIHYCQFINCIQDVKTK